MQKISEDLFTNTNKSITIGLSLLVILTFNSQIVSAQILTTTNPSNSDTVAFPNEKKVHYLKPTALIVPGAFLIYTGLKPFINGIKKLDDTIYENIAINHPNFHTSAENYLMWAPAASIYFLDAFNVKTKHNFKEHLILDAGSIVVTGGIGYAMRLLSRHINVYKTNGTKFPSGHTANAFRGAELLHQELKNNNKIISYSGYVGGNCCWRSPDLQ